MIGFLKGKIIHTEADYFILEVNGVGYKVEVKNHSKLQDQECEMFIYTYVRENELRLFGFDNGRSLQVFEKLLSVSGIGPKAAMSLISGIGLEKILQAIEEENYRTLKVPGVGPKTARKIVLELKDKLPTSSIAPNANISESEIEDALTALENLGYKRNEIEIEITKMRIEEGWSSEDIIKLVLKQFSKN